MYRRRRVISWEPSHLASRRFRAPAPLRAGGATAAMAATVEPLERRLCLAGSISGTAFHDVNGNGTLDAGESGIIGVTVFLDLNNSNSFDAGDASAVTGMGGAYSFSGLADRTYSIGQVAHANHVRTGALFQSALISGGNAAAGRNFGNWRYVFTGSSGTDQYTVRLHPSDPTKLQVLETLLGQNEVTYTVAKDALAVVIINAASGDEMITIDYTGGAPIPAMGLSIDGGSQSTPNADRITITGSGGADAVIVNHLDVAPAAGAVNVRGVEKITMNGGAGADALTLGLGLGLESATFNGGANADTLTYNGSDNVDTISVLSTSLTAGGFVASYADLEKLAINARSGEDTLFVDVPTALPALALDLGDGSDTVTLNTLGGGGGASSGVTLWGGGGSDFVNVRQAALAAVHFDGGGGDTDRITVHGTNGSDVIDVDAASVTRQGAGYATTFAQVEQLAVEADFSGDTINVNAASNALAVTVAGGDANDVMVVAAGVTTAALTFDGGTGANDVATFNAGAGNDTGIAVTATHVLAGQKQLAYSDVDALVINTLGGNDTVWINAPLAVPVTVNGGDGNDTLTLVAGSSKGVVFNGGLGAGFTDTLAVNAGTYTFAADAAAGTTNLAVNIGANGAAVFDATQHLARLSVDGSAALTAGGSKVIVTRELLLGDAGRLDLADNDLILDYSGPVSPLGGWDGSAYTGVMKYLASGINQGEWDGVGINSSAGDYLAAPGAADAETVVGFEGATTLWSGETIDATSVLIKFTYVGDGNLDGYIDGGDYAFIDAFVGSSTPTYAFGDYNYDGYIDGGDFAYIDVNVSADEEPL